MRVAVSLFILWGVVFSGGCHANFVEAEAQSEITPNPAAETLSTSMPTSPTQGDVLMTPSVSVDAGLQNLIDKARMELAQQLSIQVTQINLIQAISAIWPDSSLGCPQPGMAYSQVLTPGYLIQLQVQADNGVYEYHTDADKLVVFCGENTIEYPVKPGDIEDDKPWMPP